MGYRAHVVDVLIDGRRIVFRSALGSWYATVLVLLLAAGCRETGKTEEERLAAALAAVRPGEGRLVGAPWREITHVQRDPPRGEAGERGMRSAGRTVERERSARRLRSRAIFDLLEGDADRAVGALTRATELAPGEAVSWSDLAAVRLQLGTANADGHQLFLALVAANRAVALAPDLPEARFNRALALEHSGLRERAAAEWRRFLELERDPEWSREAYQRSETLSRQAQAADWDHDLRAVEEAVARGRPERVLAIVSSSPQRFREHVEEVLLARWAESAGAGRAGEAEAHLAAARAVGTALAASGGDRMAADTVAAIDRLRAAAPTDLGRTIEGHRAYGEGLALLAARGDFARGLPAFERARHALAAAQSPFARWAAYRMALCHYQHSDYLRARALLRELGDGAVEARYPALAGRSLWLQGLIAVIEGDPAAAVVAFKAGRSAFGSARESAYEARLRSLTAEAFADLGQPAQAWRELQPSLIEPAIHDQPMLRQGMSQVASKLAWTSGETEIARWFQAEAVRHALATGMAYRIIGALRNRGEILVASGDLQGAARDFAQARSLLPEVADAGTQEVLEADLAVAEAGLADSPERAVELLDGVIDVFRASSYHHHLAYALFARARALGDLRRRDEQERDLTAAIDELELQREKILAPEERVSYLDRRREIYDAMVQLQQEEGRPAAAFSYAEQAKARVLLDWIVAHPGDQHLPLPAAWDEPAPGEPSDLQADLPADTAVIEYAVLPERLLIWVLRRDTFTMEAVEVGTDVLERLTGRLTRELQRGGRGGFLAASSELHDLLVRPVLGYLHSGDRIVAVPDGALHGLPFGLLRDRQSGRYLAQDYVCSIAPSARVLAGTLRRDEFLRSERSPRALVFVDPAFDTELFPSLDRLPVGVLEAAAAGAFPGSRIVTGQAATRQAFLAGAGEFEIVHFGGHSLVNSEHPLLSQMLFAQDPDDPARGVLYSGAILGHRFVRTRLAVLASCSTGAGKISRTEGVESLARPFLAAGVPAVIASLWDVHDELSAEFFGRFYRHLQRTFDPAAALRVTQVESLRSADPDVADPATWGAFELVGGSVAR